MYVPEPEGLSMHDRLSARLGPKWPPSADLRKAIEGVNEAARETADPTGSRPDPSEGDAGAKPHRPGLTKCEGRTPPRRKRAPWIRGSAPFSTGQSLPNHCRSEQQRLGISGDPSCPSRFGHERINRSLTMIRQLQPCWPASHSWSGVRAPLLPFGTSGSGARPSP